MASVPKFDPNQPYTTSDTPAFDPNQPFEEVVSAPAPGFLDRLGSRYMRSVNEGVAEMREGADTMLGKRSLDDLVAETPPPGVWDRVKGAGQMALGALQYGYSPITAVSGTVVGDPVRGAMKAVGAPEWAQEMAGSTGEIGAEVLGAGPVVRGIQAAPGAFKAAKGYVSDLLDRPSFTSRPVPAPLNPRALDAAAETGTGSPQALSMQSPAGAKAETLLYKDMISAGWTPERIQAKLRQLGPGATMADLAPFAGRAEVVAQYPSGAKEATRVLAMREKRAPGELLKAVDQTLTPTNYYQSLDELRATRGAEGQINRAAALENTKIVKSDLIQRMMKTPEFQSGLRRGAQIARLEEARTGIPVPRSETWYHGKNFDDEALVIVDTPTLRMLDSAKQGFDQILKPFENKFTGKLENLGPYEVEVDKARRAIVDELRTHSGEYAKYLDKWSDTSGMMGAINRGKQVLNNAPEVTAKMLKKLSPDQREYTQIGLARDMKERIEKNPQAALKLFKQPRSAQNMRMVFGSAKAFNTFKKQALRAAAKHSTTQGAIRNSATARRELGAEGLEQEVSDLPSQAVGVGIDLATGNHLNIGRKIGGWLARKASGNPKKVGPEVADELAPVLYSDDPIIQQRMIQRMRQRTGLQIEHDANDRLITRGR